MPWVVHPIDGTSMWVGCRAGNEHLVQMLIDEMNRKYLTLVKRVEGIPHSWEFHRTYLLVDRNIRAQILRKDHRAVIKKIDVNTRSKWNAPENEDEILMELFRAAQNHPAFISLKELVERL